MLPDSLRALLAPFAPPTAAPPPGLSTGVAALDAALAGGGLPIGRLTEVVGAPGSGKTTLLRQLVDTTLRVGGWVAYVDASRTLAPRDWAQLGAGGDAAGLWVIRPTDAARAAWCADLLLRSGAFTLVVLDAAPTLTRSVAVRLTRLAREAGAALVVVGDGQLPATQLAAAVQLHVGRWPVALQCRAAGQASGARREGPGWRGPHAPRPPRHALGVAPHAPRSAPNAQRPTPRGFSVRVTKGGPLTRTVEVSCAIGVARRLCAHSPVPDRRGVAQRETGRPGRERAAAAAAIR